jgi:hypothetical protein
MPARQPLHGHNPIQNGSETGDDLTAIDPTSLSALCQEFLGQPTPYANPSPNVDEIVGDTVVPTASQAGCQAAQNETVIVVNPNNPRNLVGGANDYRVFNTRESRNDSSGVAYSSSDGGATWTNIILPGLTFQTGATGALSDMDTAGDPALAFGRNTVYYPGDSDTLISAHRSPFGEAHGDPELVEGSSAAGSRFGTSRCTSPSAMR